MASFGGGFPTSGVFPNGPPPWMRPGSPYGVAGSGSARVIDVVLGLRQAAAQGLGPTSGNAGTAGAGASFGGQAAGNATAASGTTPHRPDAGRWTAEGEGHFDGADEEQEAAPPPSTTILGNTVDLYSVIDAEPNADEAMIKKCYRKLVLRWHPDKHPENREEADDKIRLINTAYETLANPVKRQAYDSMRQALERKKSGDRLCTTCIQPRMSIPKEFMLCPLGHPDKFVRVVGMSLRVQTRDDAPGVNFKEFFKLAKFTLWWLPEVNNMCRLRTQESAGQGVDGGLNMNFMLEGAKVGCPDADVVLSLSQDPRFANLIAVASPFSQGAFRFEGAFWPDHYLAFRPPGGLRMTGSVDDANDAIDFVLVDYNTIFKYMTMDEALAVPVDAQGEGDFVKLSELRADMSVRSYFNTLGLAVWNNKEFEAFFDGHYERWDYDKKRASVRVRSAVEQLTQRLERAQRQSEVVQAVMSLTEEAAGAVLGQLAVDMFSRALEIISKASQQTLCDEVSRKRTQMTRQRILVAVGPFCSVVGANLPLPCLLRLHGYVSAMISDESADVCKEASNYLLVLAAERLKAVPHEVEFIGILEDLLALPLPWDSSADHLVKAIAPLLAAPEPAGAFVGSLRSASKAGRKLRPVAEALARRELEVLHLAHGSVAAEVLLVIVEGGMLMDEAIAKLQPPILPRLPLPNLLRLVAAIGERLSGATPQCEDVLRRALHARIRHADPQLITVPSQDMAKLAKAATKSIVIAENVLGPILVAAATALADWPLDDIATLLLSATKTNVAAETSSVQRFFTQVDEVLLHRLKKASNQELLKITLAAGSGENGKPLLDTSAQEAVPRLSDLRPAQLLLLTRGLLPLGPDNKHFNTILDFWAELLVGDQSETLVSQRRLELEADAALSADDIAHLAQILVPVVPGHAAIFAAIGKKLSGMAKSLSAVGRASVQAAFGSGAGPDFVGRGTLLQAVSEQMVVDSQTKTETNGTRRSSSSALRSARSRSRSVKLHPSSSRDVASRRRDSDRRGGLACGGNGGNGREHEKDRERERDQDRERFRENKDGDRERGPERERRELDREKERERDKERDREKERERDNDRKREKDMDHTKGRERERERSRDRDRRDRDGDSRKTRSSGRRGDRKASERRRTRDSGSSESRPTRRGSSRKRR
eukprot:TRINITY_DN13948_c0_g3_i1.p1 TRINITY_DN13948_c0_g3~~TRINITY_DN13948_c0_g3_i1.p1  ORF type:complete len:1208 (+),score=207.83 TRINITY_DN13948_c0_g3_i1:120-3626(+)